MVTNIYNYLIEYPILFSREKKMRNYKSLEAHHNYLKEGWVETINHLKTASDNFVFKTRVKPSQRDRRTISDTARQKNHIRHSETEEPHQTCAALTKYATVAGHFTL